MVEWHERVVTLLEPQRCPGVTPIMAACQLVVIENHEVEWCLCQVLIAQTMRRKP